MGDIRGASGGFLSPQSPPSENTGLDFEGIVVRRSLVLLTVAALGGASVVMATPAHAADITATCTGSATSTSVSAALGSSYSIEVGASCGRAQWSLTFGSGVTATWNSTSFPSGSPINVNPGDVITFTNSGTAALVNAVVETALNSSSKTININFSGGGGGGGGGGGSSSSSAAPGPAPVIQQFGRPASGTCADAAPTSLNWGGAENGGWSESWAEWMNGGLGGAVCTRSLTYRSSTGTWSAS